MRLFGNRVTAFLDLENEKTFLVETQLKSQLLRRTAQSGYGLQVFIGD